MFILAAVACLSGCAGLAPPPKGATQDDLLRQWGAPTARYALQSGGQRLEYATGPFGRTTWMIDVDGGGRVVQSAQVLNEAEFLSVQSTLSLDRDGLLRRLGAPGERRRGGWAGGEVWSWRYPTNDCLWFQSSIADNGRVTGSAYAIDPRCDGPSERRD